ncbi:transposase [Streptomyces pulveraceus]|uniref:transposase n=1 Tax=Streptomyces pulveraceus TaxID=68258 RepID=UPI003CD09572
MKRRHELSDVEWEFVRPLLPRRCGGRRKRLGDRTVLNGTVWKFRTGVGWRDVPERYGPWATPHTRFRRWALDGAFDRMLRAAQAKAKTRPGASTGWCRSTARLSGLTSTPPGREKKGGQFRARTPLGRTDQQDPLGLMPHASLFPCPARPAHGRGEALMGFPSLVRTSSTPFRHP